MTKNVLITRPFPDAHSTSEQIQALGFTCFIEPMLEISYRDNARNTHIIAPQQKSIFLATSANAVRAIEPFSSKEIPLIAVGDATLQAARQGGFEHAVAAEGNVDALASFVQNHYAPGRHFIYIRANVVSGNLSQTLTQAGFKVTDITVYDATPKDHFSPQFLEKYNMGAFDMALFFSARTAHRFIELLVKENISTVLLEKLQLLCLSKQVALAFEKTTAKNIHTPQAPTSESLLELVSNFKFT